MKVICAGLSKTGTKSLANALQILGYTVYDFPEHVNIHGDEWRALYSGNETPDFVSMYEGVDAVTDLPAAYWYEELLQAFPDAKVILTVRDNDEVWVQSWVKHLQLSRDLGMFSKLALGFFAKPRKFLDLATKADTAVYGSVNPTATILFKKKYNAHNERAKAVVPAEKLLVYNVKQGWDPLCQFLGVDVPSQEFPRKNVGGSTVREGIDKTVKEHKLKLSIYFILPALLILLSIVVYVFYWDQ